MGALFGCHVTTGDVLTGNGVRTTDPLPTIRVQAQTRSWRGIPSAGGVYLLGIPHSVGEYLDEPPHNDYQLHYQRHLSLHLVPRVASVRIDPRQRPALYDGTLPSDGLESPHEHRSARHRRAVDARSWLFGPVASLNVALTLAPVLSALAMFVLLRRWVTWLPAAFVGGALYGFCPFILQSLTEGQLHQGFLMFPPLIVLCLDELIFRRNARATVTGLLLGLLVTAQFFVGTEILVMFALVVACCFVIIAVFWVKQPDRSMDQIRYAATGLLVGLGVSVVLLAYPVWFALAGPAHLSGRIWPLPLPYLGNNLSRSHQPSTVCRDAGLRCKLYSAVPRTRSGGRVSRRVLRLAERQEATTRGCRRRNLAPLVIGCQSPTASSVVDLQLPAFAPKHHPESIHHRRLPGAGRDARTHRGPRLRRCYTARARQPLPHAPAAPKNPAGVAVSRVWASVAAFAVAAVALVPLAAYVAPSVPVAVSPLIFPSWFRHIGPTLPGHQVVLVLPMPFFLENSLTWQALDHLNYDLVSGVGPEGEPSRNGHDAPAQEFLDDLSAPAPTSPTVTPKAITTVRQAIDRWGVTTIVIPTDGNAPTWEWRVTSVPVSVAFYDSRDGYASGTPGRCLGLVRSGVQWSSGDQIDLKVPFLYSDGNGECRHEPERDRQSGH